MNDILEAFSAAFTFFDTVSIGGMSLITWIIIILVFTAIAFFVRGNKS